MRIPTGMRISAADCNSFARADAGAATRKRCHVPSAGRRGRATASKHAGSQAVIVAVGALVGIASGEQA